MYLLIRSVFTTNTAVPNPPTCKVAHNELHTSVEKRNCSTFQVQRSLFAPGREGGGHQGIRNSEREISVSLVQLRSSAFCPEIEEPIERWLLPPLSFLYSYIVLLFVPLTIKIIIIIIIISSNSSSSSNDIFPKAYLMYCKSVPAVSVISVVLGSFIYSLKQIWWTVSSVPVVAAIPVILEIFWLLRSHWKSNYLLSVTDTTETAENKQLFKLIFLFAVFI